MSASAVLAIAVGLLAPPHWEQTVGPRDYPAVAIRNIWSAAVIMDLVIDPRGRIVDCKAQAGFGNQDFASLFCALTSRVRLEPARDIEGRPTYGFRRDLVKMFLPGTPEGNLIRDLENMIPPDIEIEVESLAGVTDAPFLEVSVAVAVDVSGHAIECESGPNARQPGFSDVACQQIIGSDLGTIDDKSGNPVAYVRGVRARFLVAG